MKFAIPDGFEMPPDAEVGGEFEAVGTFQDNGDGTLTLIRVDGSDVSYESDEGDDEEEVEVEVEEMEEEEPTSMMERARRAGVPMKMS